MQLSEEQIIQRIERWKEKAQRATYYQARVFYDALTESGLFQHGSFVSALCKIDRFFLLTSVLRRKDALVPWLYDRCREVEQNPDGHIDLWAREHYKSTIITFAGSMQEIIKDSDITIGIFSHNKAIAKTFVDQIKTECEQNEELYKIWPDIFWQNPKREAPTWSLDKGIVVKRTSNPREKTVEGHGLVDGQPISKHFGLIVYDDVVTEESVNTPEQILKTTKMWELSRSLSALTKDGSPRRTWHIGTRYNFADTYRVILERKVVIPRIYPATDDGTRDGKPIFLSEADWGEKKRENSTYTLACQYLQNPLAGDEAEFKLEWMRKYEVRPETLNVAILVDPASSKKKGSSNSAFAVIGVDHGYNKYFLDGACHKMKLAERWMMLKGLREKWIRQPGVQTVFVGYEKYGMQADIEHFEQMMQVEKYAFPITEVSWTRDHTDAKDDRIRRLIPDHQNWRFFYPYEGEMTRLQMQADERGKGHLIAKPIKRVNEDGRLYNVIEYLVHNEILFFPATTAKDMLDAMSRIYDLKVNPPIVYKEEDLLPEYVGDD